jgi:hypothetical protein
LNYQEKQVDKCRLNINSIFMYCRNTEGFNEIDKNDDTFFDNGIDINCGVLKNVIIEEPKEGSKGFFLSLFDIIF